MPPKGSNPYGKLSDPLAHMVINFPQSVKSRKPSVTNPRQDQVYGWERLALSELNVGRKRQFT